MLRHMDPHSPYLPPAPFDRMFYHGDETDPRLVTCKVRTTERADQRYKVISLKRNDKVTIVGRVTSTDPAAKEEFAAVDHGFVVPQ